MTTVKNIYDFLDRLIDFSTQESWDNSGFLIGDFRSEVKKAVISLDVTKEVVNFAKEQNADLILSHHPVIFSGEKSVLSNSVVYDCIKNSVSVISCHTCLDKADGGINDILVELLNARVIEKSTNGFLTFAELENEVTLHDFAKNVANKLDSKAVRYAGSERPVKKIAVCSGAGDNDFVVEAQNYGADVYLTGDMKYHEMLDAEQNGFAVVSAGHFETEYLPTVMFFEKLKNIFTDVEFLSANQINSIKTV